MSQEPTRKGEKKQEGLMAVVNEAWIFFQRARSQETDYWQLVAGAGC